MEEQRAGRVLRAVRRRQGLTQAKVAELAGVSQQTVSFIERGHAEFATLSLVKRVARPLGITVDLVFRWKGPELDRLVDARHARIVRAVVARLDPDWQVLVEYTFNHFGDRGSVDVLAWHAARRALLLVEVKSELDSLEAVLRSMDVKIRVVPGLTTREKGWRIASIGSILVLPDESTARRAVNRLGPVFDVALPSRTVSVRRWLRSPAGPMRGIWFLADTPTRRAIRNPGSAGLVRPAHDRQSHAQQVGSKAGSAVRNGAISPAAASGTTVGRR
jgi:transcriptional regulator with XRE-family HTH domain